MSCCQGYYSDPFFVGKSLKSPVPWAWFWKKLKRVSFDILCMFTGNVNRMSGPLHMLFSRTVGFWSYLPSWISAWWSLLWDHRHVNRFAKSCLRMYTNRCACWSPDIVRHCGICKIFHAKACVQCITTLPAIGFPDSKDIRANMGPTWVLSAPGGPHVGPMNLDIRVLAH